MKKVLGLDLGTTSIGWALVNEAENKEEKSEIIKLGVRVVPLTVDENTNYQKGSSITTTAERTAKRAARRNLQRFKLRRESLIKLLIDHQLIKKDTPLTEIGENTTHQTLKNRAKAAREKVSLTELAKIFLTINKKRGYKSSRKLTSDDEGVAIDGMAVAKELYDTQSTPGQFVYRLLREGKKYIPDFYASDLKNELDLIWNHQKNYYGSLLSSELKNEIRDKTKSHTWAILKSPFNLMGIKLEGKRDEQKLKKYELRSKGLSEKLELEHLAIALQEINNDANKSSGYLGNISDRSKKLYINKVTIGEYLYNQISKNPHTRSKGQIFYRQDYLDEFEQIWETQSKFHPELTNELKEEIRDRIIFYQRKLKSQKGLINICEFESFEIEIDDPKGGKKTKRVGPRVIPRSSPLFQSFKIHQQINNVKIINLDSEEEILLDDDSRALLYDELWLRGNLKESEILKLLGLKKSEWKTNYSTGLNGNNFMAKVYDVLQVISENEGYGFDWNKKSAKEINTELNNTLPLIGIDNEILNFNPLENLDQQVAYKFWHLIYSAEEDNITNISENDQLIYGKSMVNLKKKLHEKYGFKPEYAKMLANLSFNSDYGNLSSKAIKKIMPLLQKGLIYSDAAKEAGYNHSNSLTAEENDERELLDHIKILPKNALRNPVVEKILNQMIHVVNQISDTYGKPDVIRLEMARELKMSADERSKMASGINKATKKNDDIRKTLQNDFGIKNPSRNDIIRYKLYEELAPLNYKSLYTNQYISKELIFSNQVDIEHIIAKKRLLDDSLSNKTLAFSGPNKQKGNRTAYDYIAEDHASELEEYENRVNILYDAGTISRSKRKKLLMTSDDIPDNFIERDLRNTQYISKKAQEILLTAFRTVEATTGKVTDELRRDWGLINVMKELNMPKYEKLGMVETIQRRNNNTIKRIVDWSKRDDHRHHAMDALTVAFTTRNHVNYLNNKNASVDKESKLHKVKNKITEKNKSKHGTYVRKFIEPIPNFRTQAKEKLEEILISFKAKNKVVTRNVNKYKVKGGKKAKVQLTPRGELHEATIYAKIKTEVVKEVKISGNFSIENAQKVCDPETRDLLLLRLNENDNNPKKAFSGKNALSKNPILNSEGKEISAKVKVKYYEDAYTIRKEVEPGLNVKKIIDQGIKRKIEERIEEYGGNKKLALSDLEKNPIWLNKDAGIAIKRVTISGVANAEPLHDKKDHNGQEILKDGNNIPIDYISYGNNHHIAIYEDSEGNLYEDVVPFAVAVARAISGMSIIQEKHPNHPEWNLKFTMKQNEMFIIPYDNVALTEIDVLDENNSKLISPYLFRVQSISSKDYRFRHHLESKSDNNIESSYIRLRSTKYLKSFIKIRLNHIGKIVQIGEY